MADPFSRRRTPPKDVRVVDIEIPNDVNYIEKVVEMVRHECAAMRFDHRQLALNVPVALAEALSNAILRGNGDDPGKHVRVRAEVDSERLVVEVVDEGPGFDFDAKLVEPAEGDLDREDGRGLFLMRKLMDRVERVSVPRGSAVRMTLHRG
jgi:serine/threonine-protein kinase RsbW